MHFTFHPTKPLPVNQPFTSQEPTDLNQLQLNLYLGTEDSLVAEIEPIWRYTGKKSVLRYRFNATVLRRKISCLSHQSPSVLSLSCDPMIIGLLLAIIAICVWNFMLGCRFMFQICRDINRIKVCMETGRTVILLNLESLYESLYDALNQV